jgi:hypothetical protein
MGQILDRYRTSQGWQPLPDADHAQMVAAWLEVLHVAGVPAEQFDACYRAAIQTRLERRARGEELGPLSANDLATEWVRVRAMHAELNKTRLLPENAVHACQACFGTGFRRMPDGSVRPGCSHEGMTLREEEEYARSEDERREEVRRQTELLREAMSKIGSPRPARNVPEPKPKGTPLICTNPACRWRVSTYFGFEEGQTCSDLLNRGEGEPKLCEGVLRKI